jgi:hypothetical protein
MELKNILDWMEQYIPEITDGEIQTKSELEKSYIAIKKHAKTNSYEREQSTTGYVTVDAK